MRKKYLKKLYHLSINIGIKVFFTNMIIQLIIDYIANYNIVVLNKTTSRSLGLHIMHQSFIHPHKWHHIKKMYQCIIININDSLSDQ